MPLESSRQSQWESVCLHLAARDGAYMRLVPGVEFSWGQSWLSWEVVWPEQILFVLPTCSWWHWDTLMFVFFTGKLKIQSPWIGQWWVVQLLLIRRSRGQVGGGGESEYWQREMGIWGSAEQLLHVTATSLSWLQVMGLMILGPFSQSRGWEVLKRVQEGRSSLKN